MWSKHCGNVKANLTLDIFMVEAKSEKDIS